MLSIVSWNVNSIRRRLDGLARLAETTNADVICLQETKTEDATFEIDGAYDNGCIWLTTGMMSGYVPLKYLGQLN